MPKTLIVTPDRNHHGNDWSGAFKPEAERLVKIHGLHPTTSRLSISLDGNNHQRRKQLQDALVHNHIHATNHSRSVPVGTGWVVFLCHGWASGIQVGWGLDNLPALAETLATVAAPTLKVTLYACSTAESYGDNTPDPPMPEPHTIVNYPGGDGGFADILRDCLSKSFSQRGIAWTGWVDAHDRKGHCTSNPYVKRFYPASNPSHNALGADFLIPPGQPIWQRWNAILHDRDHDSDQSRTLRLRYPLMTHDQIIAELIA